MLDIDCTTRSEEPDRDPRADEATTETSPDNPLVGQITDRVINRHGLDALGIAEFMDAHELVTAAVRETLGFVGSGEAAARGRSLRRRVAKLRRCIKRRIARVDRARDTLDDAERQMQAAYGEFARTREELVAHHAHMLVGERVQFHHRREATIPDGVVASTRGAVCQVDFGDGVEDVHVANLVPVDTVLAEFFYDLLGRD
jgi:hypothetical protein